MKIQKILFKTVGLALIFILHACTIEGEALAGIWVADTDESYMRIHIKPWQGKFHGYMLDFQQGDTYYAGGETKESIILTDLVAKDGSYQQGKFYYDINGGEPCHLALSFVDDHTVKAVYDCQGEQFEEQWVREGSQAQKPKPSKRMSNVNRKEGVDQTPVPSVKSTSAQTKQKSQPTTTKDETKQHGAFSIIGYQKQIPYDDEKLLEKTTEELWTKLYAADFSSKLSNISAADKIYVTYSSYDSPKGMMTMTIGYAVADLSGIPAGLHGVDVPANRYYVVPLAEDEVGQGNAEAWDQLAMLMASRSTTAVDFEVYTLDASYEVTQAEMWLAAK